MAIFNSKWKIVALLILVTLLILFLIGRKSVHEEISIPASPEKVWLVLTDFSTINEWNQVLVPVAGDLKAGNTIKYTFTQEPGKNYTIDARVKTIAADSLLNQSGGIPGILTFDHKYILSREGGQTKVIIHEEYRGMMVPFWNPAPVKKAYANLLQALKSRIIHLNSGE